MEGVPTSAAENLHKSILTVTSLACLQAAKRLSHELVLNEFCLAASRFIHSCGSACEKPRLFR